LSANTDEARRRAEALFKKEQQLREAQQAMAEYQTGLHMMRQKTARLRRCGWRATPPTRKRRGRPTRKAQRKLRAKL
jgi:hypothetical protein